MIPISDFPISIQAAQPSPQPVESSSHPHPAPAPPSSQITAAHSSVRKPPHESAETSAPPSAPTPPLLRAPLHPGHRAQIPSPVESRVLSSTRSLSPLYHPSAE